MPFDFTAYDEKCRGLTAEELQREWQHYTRLISGASTSTAVSGLAVPLTLGVSTIGVALAAPAIHNARKKREIIEQHLQRHNTTHVTRKRDVLGSMAVSGTIGIVTLGVGTAGADALATTGAEHGISAIVENETAIKIVTHAALDGVGLATEHAHTSHLKKKDAVKAFQAAGTFEAVSAAKAQEAGYDIQNHHHHQPAQSSDPGVYQPPYNPQTYQLPDQQPTLYYPPPPRYSTVLDCPPQYPPPPTLHNEASRGTMGQHPPEVRRDNDPIPEKIQADTPHYETTQTLGVYDMSPIAASLPVSPPRNEDDGSTSSYPAKSYQYHHIGEQPLAPSPAAIPYFPPPPLQAEKKPPMIHYPLPPPPPPPPPSAFPHPLYAAVPIPQPYTPVNDSSSSSSSYQQPSFPPQATTISQQSSHLAPRTPDPGFCYYPSPPTPTSTATTASSMATTFPPTPLSSPPYHIPVPHSIPGDNKPQDNPYFPPPPSSSSSSSSIIMPSNYYYAQGHGYYHDYKPSSSPGHQYQLGGAPQPPPSPALTPGYHHYNHVQ